ncbi:glycoside hydrolase family 3 C-terminal domain-containing protein [Lysobacter sp. CCNWLW3]|uniref:glycoside hydrolase family 3 C-terminal domain-containing protein n=1 Tax=unclassified Lysobacter TaxID=2635362 RepID=UPI002FD6D980
MRSALPALRRLASRCLAGVAVLAALAAAPAHACAPEPQLSVVSLNLWHDKSDWPARQRQIVAELRRLRPDVIALQEVLQHENLPNQAQSLADALGYRAYFVSVDAADAPRRYGNAILTRRPVLALEWRPLQPADDYRNVAHARIVLDGRVVNVYATHLHYKPEGGAIRKRQIDDLLAYVDATSDGAPSIVAGDFNAPEHAPEFARFGRRFHNAYGVLHPGIADDAREHSTLNLNQYAPLRIDHVYYEPAAFAASQAEILFRRADADGVWASDHYGMHARLRLLPRRAEARPWRDRALGPDARASALLARMSRDEKFALIRSRFGLGRDGGPRPEGALGSAGYVAAIERLGIPALQLADADLGVTNPGGIRPGDAATAMPSGLASAATWDPDAAEAVGAVMGEEAWRSGFNVLLAGSVNLLRDPRNGRNFEYAGEDPLLAGTLVGRSVRGIQRGKVLSTLKHFALNDLETGRNSHDARLGAAAMRESDLLAFELALELGDPGAVMCAYNRVNGDYACENQPLLEGVLKRDWGYPGFVMSDWGGVHSAAKAALAGLDQQSAGEVFDKALYFDAPLRQAIARGEVPAARLDDMVRRILRAMFAGGLFDRPPQRVAAQPAAIDEAAGAAVAQRAIEQGAVLLRNRDGALPLAASVRSIAVIGGHADVGVLAGGGSSVVLARGGNAVPGLAPTAWPGPVMFHPSSPLRALQARAGAAQVRYDDGRDPAAAARLAAEAEVAIVFATQWSTESVDQADLGLGEAQDALIAAVARANPRTVVVLESNGPVRMPWLDATAAVLQAWYPGGRGGEGLAGLLYGDVNPSGHLPMSWPRDESQLPRPHIDGLGMGNRTPPPQRIDYDIEGANVGYKWYAARGLSPLFAFGHGLSYTRFGLEKLDVRAEGRRLRVYFEVVNTGSRAGAEVAQVYLQPPSQLATPLRLLGWRKVLLQPGERRRVAVEVDPRLLAFYDAEGGDWRIHGGRYGVVLAADAGQVAERVEIELAEQRFPAAHEVPAQTAR